MENLKMECELPCSIFAPKVERVKMSENQNDDRYMDRSSVLAMWTRL